MKPKPPDEFEQFDKVMDGLLAVPYSELQKKLEEERRAKEGKAARERERSTTKKRARGYQMNCVSEFPSSVGTRPS